MLQSIRKPKQAPAMQEMRVLKREENDFSDIQLESAPLLSTQPEAHYIPTPAELSYLRSQGQSYMYPSVSDSVPSAPPAYNPSAFVSTHTSPTYYRPSDATYAHTNTPEARPQIRYAVDVPHQHTQHATNTARPQTYSTPHVTTAASLLGYSKTSSIADPELVKPSFSQYDDVLDHEETQFANKRTQKIYEAETGQLQKELAEVRIAGASTNVAPGLHVPQGMQPRTARIASSEGIYFIQCANPECQSELKYKRIFLTITCPQCGMVTPNPNPKKPNIIQRILLDML